MCCAYHFCVSTPSTLKDTPTIRASFSYSPFFVGVCVFYVRFFVPQHSTERSTKCNFNYNIYNSFHNYQPQLKYKKKTPETGRRTTSTTTITTALAVLARSVVGKSGRPNFHRTTTYITDWARQIRWK